MESLTGKTILIVEDCVCIRAFISSVLTSCGCYIIEAENGLDGIAIAEKNELDAIVTDINMPVMNGITMLRNLRRIEGRAIPVIVISSDIYHYLATLRRLNVTLALAKPCSATELISGLAKVLAQSKVISE